MNNPSGTRGGSGGTSGGAGGSEPSALSLLVNAADRDGPGGNSSQQQQQQQGSRSGSSNQNTDQRMQELQRLRAAAGLGGGTYTVASLDRIERGLCLSLASQALGCSFCSLVNLGASPLSQRTLAILFAAL